MNRKKIKKWKILVIIILVIIAIPLLLSIGIIAYQSLTSSSTTTQETQVEEYIDIEKDDILKQYDDNIDTHTITMTKAGYNQFMSVLNKEDYIFKYAKYYGLEETLKLYNNTTVNKSMESNLLDNNGKLSSSKLLQQVQKNNEEYMSQGKNAINVFYEELDTSDMNYICDIITEVVNSSYNDIPIQKTANTLTKLTMFKKTSSSSNAYITNDLTFVYNPKMIGMFSEMQQISGSENDTDTTLKSVIVHEAMHLLQYSTNDNNTDNGIEAGICRMYNVPNLDKKVAVDCLWNKWLLEAGAELNMAEYLNIEAATYAKKISYVKSYNLSRFYDLNIEENGIEDIVFLSSLEEAYKYLSIDEKKEFLKFMYSIEITQSDPEEFWDNYISITGDNPTDEQKTQIRMTIREEAIKYLTKNFYQNLIEAIKDKKITDLNTIFYLMKNWELDAYSHLEYTKLSSKDSALDFIEYQYDIQKALLEVISSNNHLSLEDITSMYNNYHLQAKIDDEVINKCNLEKLDKYTQTYILSAKEKYNSSNYVSNSDMYNKYIKK